MDGLLACLATNRFPKLHGATVQYNPSWAGYASSRNVLKKRSMDLEFTDVGYFRVTNLVGDMTVRSETKTITRN